MFQITRVYSDDHGESHFADINIEIKDNGTVGWLSDPVNARQVIFREVESTYDWDFHCAPQKQYIVLLDGEIEIETSLGEKRVFGQGEILLVEDTWGRDHKTRNMHQQKRRSLFIKLAD